MRKFDCQNVVYRIAWMYTQNTYALRLHGAFSLVIPVFSPKLRYDHWQGDCIDKIDFDKIGRSPERLRLKFIFFMNSPLSYCGGMVGLCVKRSPLTKVTLVGYPVKAICELSCALVLWCATRVFHTIPFFFLQKTQTLSIFGSVVLLG